jgi:hypothetical protein
MKKIAHNIFHACVLMFCCSFSSVKAGDDPSVYVVRKLKRPITIDGNWNKAQWRKIKEISVNNFMGEIPAFKPVVKAKMIYDEENFYVIFKVEDRRVRIQVDRFNGPVSGDACVELFFSPDSEHPLNYFNLEINAGGTALMAYHEGKSRQNLSEQDFKDVVIAHTLPKKLDGEIEGPVTWTLEYKLPIKMLKPYSRVTQPKKNVAWKANFYKTSSRSTNPHYLTWSVVNHPTPQFHLPQYFGTLIFK